jgi:hypothetical protein
MDIHKAMEDYFTKENEQLLVKLKETVEEMAQELLELREFKKRVQKAVLEDMIKEKD